MQMNLTFVKAKMTLRTLGTVYIIQITQCFVPPPVKRDRQPPNNALTLSLNDI